MNIINKTLSQLYGKPCWGCIYDRDTNLHLNFGEPVLTIREPRPSSAQSRKARELFARRYVAVRGKWRLWVFAANWKITFDGKRAATNLSSYRKIQIARARLQGQILTNAEIDPQKGLTRFEFDLGGVLKVQRWKRKSKHDLWLLYKPNGYILAIRGDGQYSHQRGDCRAEKTFPIPSQSEG